MPLTVAALALAVLAGLAPAAAPAPGPITVVDAADQYEIVVADPGSPAGRETLPAGLTDASPAGASCRYLPSFPELDPPGDERGAWWYVVCNDGYAAARFLPVGAAAPAAPSVGGVTPAELARQAAAQLSLGRPDVRTAPPRGTPSLVNLPTLVWLPAGSWAERTRRVQAGDVWAEATARPHEMRVAAAGVGEVTCRGPGRPNAADCALTFRRPGRYELVVAVQWGGAWVGSGDSTGTLPTLETRATVEVDVVEAHSVLVAAPWGR